MKLKDAVYAKCGECNRDHGLVSKEEYGCDECMQPISRGLTKSGNHRSYLQATAHRHSNGDAKDYEFCSWKCALAGLAKVKTDYFISLPYLTYDDEDQVGIRAQDFFEAMGEFTTSRPMPQQEET